MCVNNTIHALHLLRSGYQREAYLRHPPSAICTPKPRTLKYFLSTILSAAPNLSGPPLALTAHQGLAPETAVPRQGKRETFFRRCPHPAARSAAPARHAWGGPAGRSVRPDGTQRQREEHPAGPAHRAEIARQLRGGGAVRAEVCRRPTGESFVLYRASVLLRLLEDEGVLVHTRGGVRGGRSGCDDGVVVVCFGMMLFLSGAASTGRVALPRWLFLRDVIG